MPEGHTIHRLAREHRKIHVGEALHVSSPQGRFADDAAILDGRTLHSVDAHGKHLLYTFSGGKRVHVHLGLYGKFKPFSNPPPEPRGAVRMRVVGSQSGFDLNGPNRCEMLKKTEWQTIQNRLGPDPLRSDASPETAWLRIRRSKSPIGKLLLDQSVIAGVGNVYRSEVLFLLGIHPERPGNEIAPGEFDNLWQTLVELLEIGVKYNRIIVASPEELGKARHRMTRHERLLIYKHLTCTRCDRPVDAWDLGARRAYACRRCQR